MQGLVTGRWKERPPAITRAAPRGLQEALKQSPDDAATHWQLGQVWITGKWMTPEQTEKMARRDKRLAEYRKQRDRSLPTVESQTALARWCRKNKLAAEERARWQIVLRLQPDNAEAIRGLGLKPYGGTLLTQAQIQQIKNQLQRQNKAVDRWRSLVARWRNAVERHQTAPPPEAAEKIAKTSDPTELLALERTLWQEVGVKRYKDAYRTMLRTMVEILDANPSPAAAMSLARQAVFSPAEDVRKAAIRGLKKHPLDHYAPLLLSGLQTPIEAEAQYALAANGDLIARYAVFQEGALANESLATTLSPIVETLSPVMDPAGISATGAAAADARGVAQARQANAMAARATTRPTRRIRGRKRPRTRPPCTTRSDAPTRPSPEKRPHRGRARSDHRLRAWRQSDEMVDLVVAGLQRILQRQRRSRSRGGNPPYKPEYHSEFHQYQGSAPPTRPRQRPWTFCRSVRSCCVSCFSPGTKVWTLTGRQAIETLKVGDRVLAQDVESGELAYKPVLAVTTASPWTADEICLGSDTIVTTPSHPFWVAGQGWRMTKQLAAGSRLHTLSGGAGRDHRKTPHRSVVSRHGLQPDRRRFRQLFRRRRGDPGPRQHAPPADLRGAAGPEEIRRRAEGGRGKGKTDRPHACGFAFPPSALPLPLPP